MSERPETPRRLIKNIAVGVFGLSVGAIFLVLALRNVQFDDLATLVAATDRRMLGLAAAIYWGAIGLRVLRWQLLLRELKPAPMHAVAETLLVGYAVNNILPARLGEVARAAYAKRRLKIGRARVFGSIVAERFLDLVAILACLGGGLLALRVAENAVRLPSFEIIAINAGAVVGLVILALAVLRSAAFGRMRMPAPLAAVFQDFCAGVATLNRNSAVLAIALSAGVWSLETLALAKVFQAVGVDLSVTQALLLMGAASLSTLVPTAPGYLGTYQLVAVIAMGSFGYGAPAGIVAATAVQVVLFGSVTAIGLLVVAVRGIRRIAIDGTAGLAMPSAPVNR